MQGPLDPKLLLRDMNSEKAAKRHTGIASSSVSKIEEFECKDPYSGNVEIREE